MKKIVLIVAAVFVGVALVAGIGIYIWANSLLNEIQRFPTEDTSITTVETESTSATTETVEKDPVVEEAEKILSSKNVINILIVGQDRRADEEEERTRSDSMILLTVNTSVILCFLTVKAGITSFNLFFIE